MTCTSAICAHKDNIRAYVFQFNDNYIMGLINTGDYDINIYFYYNGTKEGIKLESKSQYGKIIDSSYVNSYCTLEYEADDGWHSVQITPEKANGTWCYFN